MSEIRKEAERIMEDQGIMLSALYVSLTRVVRAFRSSAEMFFSDGEDDSHLDHQPPPDYIATA